jgi:cytochrome bd-type quinol oxidase subunit 1
MAVAWLFFAPSGVLVARHGKASKTWFSTHRASGMAVAALTLLSAWYIISVRGWSTPWGKHGKTGGVILFWFVSKPSAVTTASGSRDPSGASGTGFSVAFPSHWARTTA